MFRLPWHPGPLAAKLRPGLAALFALRLASRFAACKPGPSGKKHGQRLAIVARKRSKNRCLELKIQARPGSDHMPHKMPRQRTKPFQETYLATLYKSVEVWRVLLAPAKTTIQSENSVLRNTRPSANRFACMPAFLHQEAR